MQLLELGLVIFCSGYQFPTSSKATTGRKDYRLNLFSSPSFVVHHPPNSTGSVACLALRMQLLELGLVAMMIQYSNSGKDGED
jgi:hypothetical protein